MKNTAENVSEAGEPERLPDSELTEVEGKLAASEDTPAPKRPRGRPPANGMPAGTSAPDRPLPVPRPKFKEFKSGAGNQGQTSSAGWRYWASLPAWAKDQVTAYVYRTHPVLKLREDDQEHDPGSNPNIEKLPGTSPIEDDLDLLNRYGCGDYHVRLNDTSKPRNEQTVCIIYVKGIGGGDYRNCPPTDPRIDDIEQVDVAHPANAAYVAYLRGKGKLPEQVKKAKDDQDMATIEAANKAIDSQHGIIRELLNERRANTGSGTSASDILEVADRLAERYASNNSSLGPLLDELRSMRQELGKRGNDNQTDLIMLVLPLLERIMSRQSADNPELTALRTQIDRLTQDRIQSLERQLEQARSQVSSPATNSLTDQLEALRKSKEFIEELQGPRTETNPVEEAARDAAPKWLRPLLPLVQPLAQAGISYFMSRSQVAPNGAMPGVPPGFPGSAPVAHNPQPQELPAPSPNGIDPNVANLLTAIAYPLTSRLMDPEPDGAEFANWFAQGYGLQTYRFIVQLGTHQIVDVLYKFPPIANAITAVPQPVVHRFVEDFVQESPKLEQGQQQE